MNLIEASLLRVFHELAAKMREKFTRDQFFELLYALGGKEISVETQKINEIRRAGRNASHKKPDEVDPLGDEGVKVARKVLANLPRQDLEDLEKFFGELRKISKVIMKYSQGEIPLHIGG